MYEAATTETSDLKLDNLQRRLNSIESIKYIDNYLKDRKCLICGKKKEDGVHLSVYTPIYKGDTSIKRLARRARKLSNIKKNLKDSIVVCSNCREIGYKNTYTYNRVIKEFLTSKKSLAKRKKRARSKLGFIFLDLYKKNRGCKQCGNTDYRCLQFHHRDPSEKEDNVSNLVKKRRWKKLMVELKKCDVLCANCHTLLHINEKTTLKTKL